MKALILFCAVTLCADAPHVGHVDPSDSQYLQDLHRRMVAATEAYNKGLSDMKEKYGLTDAGEFSDDFTHTIKSSQETASSIHY